MEKKEYTNDNLTFSATWWKDQSLTNNSIIPFNCPLQDNNPAKDEKENNLEKVPDVKTTPAHPVTSKRRTHPKKL
jgi:hypothetical protein